MDDIDAKKRVGVLGATGLVGTCLFSLLIKTEWRVTAYSRRPVEQEVDGVEWRCLSSANVNALFAFQLEGNHIDLKKSGLPCKDKINGITQTSEGNLPLWICVAPIWVLPAYFALLKAHGVRRLVVLSSTSCFSKSYSSDPEEQALARRLTNAEACVREWAENNDVEWVILRPTLIYGLGQDKNITEIACFIRRFGFFPLFGRAKGLRQPIHAEDVAGACVVALQATCAANRDYNISGGEMLSYREMVARVFSALGRRPLFMNVPLWVFRIAVAVLRHLPRYRLWTPAMAERMNRDLVFDHSDAARDLGFKPRAFMLKAVDLPT